MSSNSSQNKGPSFIELAKPFLFGMISGCTATLAIQPLDTIKVRIQVVSEEKGMGLGGDAAKRSTSPFSVGREILSREGIKGFYKGLDAALLRQVFYGTTRFGLYTTISNYIQSKEKRVLTFSEKVFASLTAGFIGSVIGNPADLSLVRLQVDGLAPPEQRRNYKNVSDALLRMVREEGVLTLWRGSTPTIIRALAMNLGQLTTFDEVKERIAPYLGGKTSVATRASASFIAGVVCSVLSLPPDNIKTRLMKMRKDANGQFPYKGFWDCWVKTASREGILGLWVGLGTYIIRVGPHAIISLLFMDWLNTNFGKKNF